MVIALGTHQGMSEEHLARHLGYSAGAAEETYPGWKILNHESWLPETFTTLGTIGAERLSELTGGLMSDISVDVRINRHVAEADVAIVVGPVFPHEVVGFSGGNKYFFPGVSGQELIDLSHWVGALITSAEMIGTRGVTPVRALVNEAATLIPAERLALCLVVASGTDTLHAAAFGTPEDAWAACAEISAETHVSYRDAPGQAGAVDHAHQVRGHLDRGQGLLQAGADRRRRRRGDHLRPAHHPGVGDAPPHHRDRLPQPGLLPRPVGPVQGPALGRPGALHPPPRAGHLGSRARRAATGSPSPSRPASPRRSSGRSTSTTSTRRRVDIAAYEADPDTFVEPHAGEVLYRLRPSGSGTGRGEPDGRQPSSSGLDG